MSETTRCERIRQPSVVNSSFPQCGRIWISYSIFPRDSRPVAFWLRGDLDESSPREVADEALAMTAAGAVLQSNRPAVVMLRAS